MDSISAGRLGRPDQVRDVQIALRRLVRPDADRTVGQLDPQPVPIGRRVDRHRLDPEVMAGPHDPNGTLAPVRDEHSAQHHAGSSSKSGCPYSTGSAFATRILRMTPACSALNSLKSFMASRMQSVWPTSTESPSSTNAGWLGDGER